MNSDNNIKIIEKYEKIRELNPNKIILIIKKRENKRLLKKVLQQNYQVLVPNSKEELINKSFDLIIIDEYILQEYGNMLQEIRNSEKPVFLPVLLLTSQNNEDILYKELQTVDDLIRTPVGKAILKTRIKNLLHIRKLSLESDQRYHALAEKSPVGICILHSQKIVYANPAFTDICGKRYKDIFATPFLKFVYNDDKKKIKTIFEDNKTNKRSEELRIIGNNTYRWVDFSSTDIIYKEKKSILITVLDITKKKKSEKKIRYLSFHDKLTGLYNRVYLEEEIERLNTVRQLPLSIIMGDVNGLKLVNDAFGHQTGNRLLHKIGNILKSVCRKEDIISRWGGDEFVILLPSTTEKIGREICRRIKEACKEAQKKPIQLSIALGVATKDKSSTKIKDVLKKAEDRMYKNKIAGNESVRNSIIASLENTLLEKSHETKDHAERMNKLSVQFGRQLDLSPSILDELKLLTKLHDIGKVSIPERILKKPDILTAEEYEIVKGHPESGYRIVKAIPELAPVAEAILSHHERWDGTGYPRGLKKKDIPYIARILAIIDTYDVMTHQRSYKKALSKEKAIEEIRRCAGTQFDPELVGVFIEMIR